MCLQYFCNSVAERTESSDSGVDANSVSSCELSNLQQESPRDLFNKQQCVDYLQNGQCKSYSILFIYLFICYFIYCFQFLVNILKWHPLSSFLMKLPLFSKKMLWTRQIIWKNIVGLL